MAGIATTIASLKKRGGGISAPLFFTMVIAALAAAFILVRMPAAHGDSLLRYVPADAAFYAHASRDATAQLLKLGGMDDLEKPSEAAIFSRRIEGGFGWGALVSWDNDRQPDNDKAAKLKQLGWHQLSDSVYSKGIYAAGPASLEEDENVARALSATRGASLVQAFIRPSLLAWPAIPSGFEFDSDYVAGIRLSNETLSAVIIPVEEAAKSGILGIRRPGGKASSTSRFLTMPGADFNLGMEKPDFSAFDLFFSQYPLANAAGSASEEEQRIRQALSGPIGLSIKSGDGAGSGVAMHLPSADVVRVKADLEIYIPLAWPTKKILRMPDDSRMVELSTVGAGFKAMDDDSRVSEMAVNGQKNIYIAGDGISGIVIANNSAMVSQMLKSRSESSCSLAGGSSVSFSTKILGVGDESGLFLGLKSVTLYKNGDNMMLLCGYIGENVDKFN